MREKCSNCGHEYVPEVVWEDEFGKFTLCSKCGTMFDVSYGAEQTYKKIGYFGNNAIWVSKLVYVLTEKYTEGIGVNQDSVICVSIDKQFCKEQMGILVKADIYGLFEENGAEQLDNNTICSCNEDFEEYVTYQIHEFELNKPWVDFRERTR